MESFRVMALKKHKVEEKLPGRSKSEVVEVKRTPISDPCPKCGGPTTIRYASKGGAPWRVCNKYPVSCSWKQAVGSDVDPNKVTPLPRTKIVPLPKESGKKSYAQAAFEKSITAAVQPKKDEEGDLIPPLAVAEADKRNCELCQKPMLIIQSGYDKKYYYACPDYDPDKHPSVEEYR
jgi:ssDNA-binding Zn-finger/Zn-ribbon topoisomerase 1